MSLVDAALRQEVREAMGKVLLGDGPRNVFERVIFTEAREQLARLDRERDRD